MSDPQWPDRDDELGAALRALRPPPHQPGFDAQLRARLDDEGPAKVSRWRRRSWWPRPVRMLMAGAAVAAVVSIVAAGLDEAGRGPLGPGRATAAEIVQRAQRALSAARTLAGVMIVRERVSPDEPVRRSRLRFAITSRGDVRVLGTPDFGDIYYDARSATQVIRGAPGARGPFLERGLAPGAPDPAPAERVLQGQLAAVTRILAEAGDASVTERDVDGRPAWVLDRPTPVNKLGYTGDRIQVAVDRTTGLPLRVRETFRGRLVRELELRNVRVNRTFPRRAFRPRVSLRPPTTVIEAGFRPAALERAKRTVGYAPLLPSRLPDGFRRAETRVAATSQPTGSEGLNPPSVGVVSTAYRRGVDRILVTTRLRGGADVAWSDPISAGEGFRVAEQRTRLTQGALAGRTARVVIDPRAIPHLWILDRKLVVTISGPVGRQDLLAAAESLVARR